MSFHDRLDRFAKLNKCPTYPVPKLETLLDAIQNNLLEDNEDFRSAWDRQHDVIASGWKEIKHKLEGQDNWATPRFENFMLSLRTPLVDSSLASTHPPLASNAIDSASKLLFAIATVLSSNHLIDFICRDANKDRPSSQVFESRQLRHAFGTIRVPGKATDYFQTSTESRHVLVWAKGQVYVLYILNSDYQPHSIEHIAASLTAILLVVATKKQHDGIGKCSTRMDRSSWATRRLKFQKVKEFALLESAITSIAIENDMENITDSIETQLQAVKGKFSGNVYGDQTMGFSVFHNGDIACRMDHAALDGGVASRILHVIMQVGQSISFDSSRVLPTTIVSPLVFQSDIPDDIAMSNNSTTFPTAKQQFQLTELPRDVLDLWRQTGLFHSVLQVAYQATLVSIMETSPALVVMPTAVRKFAQGRCDPSYIASKESQAFIQALLQDIVSPDSMLALYCAAHVEFQKTIKTTKQGVGIGPGMSLLRTVIQTFVTSSSSDKHTLLSSLSIFQKPSAYVTGSTQSPHVTGGDLNIFADNQWYFVYSGTSPDAVINCNVGCSGASNVTILPTFAERFKSMVWQIGQYATALGSVLAMYPPPQDGLGHLARFAAQRNNISSNNVCTSGSIVLHAGAGEALELGKEVMGIIMFVLEFVTFVASSAISRGESAVNVAQDTVVALENAFYFNAGKGAVLNANGIHELEACIIDGCTGAAGAVACTSTLRNPILGARAVMDNSSHTLLAGHAADAFGKAHGVPLVPSNDYFTTHHRAQQFAHLKSEVGNNKLRRHPQTVGAIVRDAQGNLAVASSTGGVVNKLPGRIGDTAIVGAGLFADEDIAVACSGEGDAFLRKSVASEIAARVRYTSMSAKDAIDLAMKTLKEETGAFGGAVAIDNDGIVHWGQSASAFFVGKCQKGQPIHCQLQDAAP